MKHLKVKLTTLSLLAILTISVFITSCQKDGLTTEDVLPAIEDTQNIHATDEANYIVVFKEDAKKRENQLQELKGKTREETIEITDRLRADFKNVTNLNLTNMKISTKKPNDYYSFINAINITLTAKEIKALEDNPLIEHIEIDTEVKVELPEAEIVDELPVNEKSDNKSAASDYWGCQNNLNGGYYWAGYQKNTFIWIMDSGIDIDHPELNVVTNNYYARSFVGGSYDDCNGHGTHVAGIAGAKANNYGIVGMSAGTPLVPIKVFNGCGENTNLSTIINALNHIYWRGKYGDVLNMSLGGQGQMPHSMVYALNNLNNKGIFIVMAAGNDSSWVGNYIPASYNNYRALTVASMSCNNNFSSFSNYGRSSIDYIAAGENTLSTYKYGQFARMSGTSMAAPVVAGIVHARANFPKTYNYVWHNGESYPRAGLW